MSLIDSTSEPLIGADELASSLGAPGRDQRAKRRWVYRLVDAGCPAIRIGSRLYFEGGAVRAWLASQRIGDWERAA